LGGPAFAQQEDLASKSERAARAMSAGRFEEAAALYAQLNRALPGNAGLLANHGLALHSAGRHREALAPLRAALKLDPKSEPALIFLGLAHLKLGEPANAVDPLTRALKADPSNRIVLLELGDALLGAGRPEEAAPHFLKLTGLDPKHAKAWQGLGISYLALARRAFETLEKTAPDSPYWYVLLARSKAEQGQYRTAFYLYRKALEAAPSLEGVHTALAEIYRKTGHADWAATEQRREAESKPGKQPAAYTEARRFGALALEALSRLAALPPTAEIHELTAYALRIQKRHRESAEQFGRAFELEPSNRRLGAEFARSLWLNRDYESALPLLEKMNLRFELGDTLLELQQPEKAVPHLEAAVRAAPAQLEPHASLARAYVRLNRHAEAVEHLKTALPLDGDGSLHFQLSRAYERLGRAAEAAAARAQYQAIAAREEARRQAIDQERQITAP
jgi:tetratricopeptide (TPR) repeat protein